MALVATWGCGHAPYQCEASSQCLDQGVQGVCEPQGFCSFPDTDCPSGSRFEPDAGDALGGTCVPEDNQSICGAIGQACCDDGSDPCHGNAFCDNGTCSQCVVEAAHGITHSCYRKFDGTVWCSGLGFDGQLGNAAFTSVPTTTPVQVLDSSNNPITDAISLGLGENYSCAVRADHTVWCWGENGNCDNGGQLGIGNTDSQSTANQVIRESDGEPLSDITEVFGSFCQTCAIDTAGGVWCWGSGEGGWLGDGTFDSHAAAIPVLDAPMGSPITGAVSLTMGAAHACIRMPDDTLSCWGINDDGQLGDGTTDDHQVPTLVEITGKSISAGRFHTCAVLDDGTAKCWGRARHGRLGNGTGSGAEDGSSKPDPVTVLSELDGDPFSDVAQVIGGALTCLITTSGDPYCWGADRYGQTGTGTGSYVPAPVIDTAGQPLHDIASITARFNRACAFTTRGDLLCWGRNSEGQLGDGTFQNRGLATPMGPTCP
jgi:alpha-tubulin suppressor-like RCC1 family protein